METINITPYVKASTRLVQTASGIVIDSEESYRSATDQLSEIKKAQKLIENEKGKVLGPLNEAVSAERARWKPIETSAAQAENIIKGKMLAWHSAVQAKANAERLRIENDARIKKQETVDKKIHDVQVKQQEAAPVRVMTQTGGGAQVRKIQVFNIFDASIIPREYMTPDIQKIKQAIKDGKKVPGAGYSEEIRVAAF